VKEGKVVMPIAENELRSLSLFLVQITRAGRLRWETTADPEAYRAMPKLGQAIIRPAAAPGAGHELVVLDSNGQELGRLPATTAADASALRELWGLARRAARARQNGREKG
jgi:hypothetical protein